MSLSRKSCAPMSLKAFDLGEVEAGGVDAQGRPIFRYRRGLRAALARLRADLSRAFSRVDPDDFRRPPNNWA